MNSLFPVEHAWILQISTKKKFFVHSWWKKPKENVYLILLADLI